MTLESGSIPRSCLGIRLFPAATTWFSENARSSTSRITLGGFHALGLLPALIVFRWIFGFFRGLARFIRPCGLPGFACLEAPAFSAPSALPDLTGLADLADLAVLVDLVDLSVLEGLADLSGFPPQSPQTSSREPACSDRPDILVTDEPCALGILLIMLGYSDGHDLSPAFPR